MNYNDFLEEVINGGIEAAKASYNRPDQKSKLDGSVAGFEACRGKSPAELKLVLDASQIATHDAYRNDDRQNYWWYRCYELEVEWVCNVVSAALHNQGLPVIIPPTARGAIRAAAIVGVKDEQGSTR